VIFTILRERLPFARVKGDEIVLIREELMMMHNVKTGRNKVIRTLKYEKEPTKSNGPKEIRYNSFESNANTHGFIVEYEAVERKN